MSIGKTIEALRRDAGLSMRELSAKTGKSTAANGSVSFPYLSRIERGADHIDPENITLDKLWAIGVVLECDPLALFVESRPEIDQRYRDPAARAELFKTVDVPAGQNLGVYVNAKRRDMLLSMSDVSKQASLPPAAFGISTGFLCQVETDDRGQSGKVSGEKLWALGVVLGVDPLALFVMSRGINRSLNNGEARSRLFKKHPYLTV